MDIAVVDKSERGIITLRLYDDDLKMVECESFALNHLEVIVI